MKEKNTGKLFATEASNHVLRYVTFSVHYIRKVVIATVQNTYKKSEGTPKVILMYCKKL